MKKSMRQDPDTGDLIVNGLPGKILGVIRWLGNILLLPVLMYLFYHQAQHTRINDFMDLGPRVTTETMENWENRILRHIGDKYPDQALVLKVEETARSLTELKLQVTEMDSRLTAKMDNVEKAVRRLLED